MLADVESAHDERSMSRRRESIHNSTPSEGDQSSPLTGSAGPPAIPSATSAIMIDNTSVLHPFFTQKSDAGPVRLISGRAGGIKGHVAECTIKL